eukprot:scaffold25495_cov121-Isochrysis_galbana.AAC.3
MSFRSLAIVTPARRPRSRSRAAASITPGRDPTSIMLRLAPPADTSPARHSSDGGGRTDELSPTSF